MKRRHIATLLVTAIMGLGFIVQAETKEAPKKQTNCPVMTKNPVNPELYVDVNGKRIYVCCAGCIAKIKADPDTYIKQLEAEGIVLEKAPEMEKKDK